MSTGLLRLALVVTRRSLPPREALLHGIRCGCPRAPRPAHGPSGTPLASDRLERRRDRGGVGAAARRARRDERRQRLAPRPIARAEVEQPVDRLDDPPL